MIFKNLSSHWQQFRSTISAAPLELRAFFLFSSIITLCNTLIFFIQPNNLIHAIAPLTGAPPVHGYPLGFFFTFILLMATRIRGKRIYLLFMGIILPLVYYILVGLISFRDFGHSYNAVSQWQPIWTVMIPLFWINLLMSNKVREFCKTLDVAAIR